MGSSWPLAGRPPAVFMREAVSRTSPSVHGAPLPAVAPPVSVPKRSANALVAGSAGPAGPCGPGGPCGPCLLHSTSCWEGLHPWPDSLSMSLIDPSDFLHALTTPPSDGIAAYPTPAAPAASTPARAMVRLIFMGTGPCGRGGGRGRVSGLRRGTASWAPPRSSLDLREVRG